MYELPTEIMIGGRQYGIRNRGDYRVVLGAFSVLDDAELEQNERIISALMIFYEDLNEIEDVLNLPDIETAIKEMFKFFNCNAPETTHKARKLIDWEQDSNLISSAINKVANIEIRSEPYIHWWTFMSYYMGIGECVLATVVSIRDKTLSGKKLEKWERDYMQDNPHYFKWNHKTADEIEAEEWLKSVWNKE